MFACASLQFLWKLPRLPYVPPPRPTGTPVMHFVGVPLAIICRSQASTFLNSVFVQAASIQTKSAAAQRKRRASSPKEPPPKRVQSENVFQQAGKTTRLPDRMKILEAPLLELCPTPKR